MRRLLPEYFGSIRYIHIYKEEYIFRLLIKISIQIVIWEESIVRVDLQVTNFACMATLTIDSFWMTIFFIDGFKK